MRIDVVTIFPDYLQPLQLSLLGKAIDSGLVEVNIHDLRSFATDRHHTVDDAPYGGGAGMVMGAEPWGLALDAVAVSVADSHGVGRPLLVIPTPSGQTFTQQVAQEWAAEHWLVFACGRYEGIDSRVALHYAGRGDWSGVREVGIGDYVLAGGEVATLVMIEAITRLIPGVVGNAASLSEDSFAAGPMQSLVEGPVFTRPQIWRGQSVPDVLLGGHHAQIAEWRAEQARSRTDLFRPDLIN